VLPELRAHPDYEVLRELDRGGMGVVYLTRHKLTHRREVLKVVKAGLLEEPGAAERFLREVRLAAQLDHKNIVKVHTAVRVGELVALVMEYVEGENLARLVKARGPLPLANACEYVRQAAAGLQHAFEKGMVHRDIKPGNLMLSCEGKSQVVRILDFGLAKVRRAQDGSAHDLTGSGQVLGTPEYMAPEQVLNAARADIRADIYSLGCALYFLLSGGPPFKGNSLYELFQAHLTSEARPLNEVRPEVPAELAAVVARMMAKDPAQRPQTPAEVVQGLTPFITPALGPLPDVAAHPPNASPQSPSPSVGGVTQDSGPDKYETVVPAPPLPPTLTEGQATIGAPERTAVAGKDWKQAAGGSRKWRGVLAGGVAVLLLAGAVGLWVGGVFRPKTGEGILLLEVNEPNPDVFVDGDKVSVTWDEGGKTARVRLKSGTRKVELKKDGFQAIDVEVEIPDGKPHELKVVFASQTAPGPLAAGGDKPPPVDGGVGAGQGPPKPADNDLVAKVKQVAGIELVSIPAGEFLMGSSKDDKDALDDEKPQHMVRITKPFYLGKTKVTVGQFRRFVDATGHTTEAEKAGDELTWKKPGFKGRSFDQADDHPVVCVSWTDAKAYCDWLDSRLGGQRKVRLPSEAEWEYSCRAKTTAGPTTKFYFGDSAANLGDYAWYTGVKGTQPCGRKKPNDFGLYDMHGLAYEWCADGKRKYEDHDETDPVGPTDAGASRVCRGGSWCSPSRSCRAAIRFLYPNSYRNVVTVGFRVLVER
jgi:formylglycine-generating enzyme required for sulfatase activity/serine/threonine protein kinase